MSTEVEYYRVTPTKGEHYYAILTTRSYYDKNQPNSWGGTGNHRYFAQPTDKRYMGEYVTCGREGSGDGTTYWEIYRKDGQLYELHYDYKGMTCLEKTEPLEVHALAVEGSGPPVPIDANIKRKIDYTAYKTDRKGQ